MTTILPVTQEDRDAAANLLRDHNGGVFPMLRGLNAIRQGLDDTHLSAQAFARHRLTALEEAAKEVEAIGKVWGTAYQSTTNEIAAAIRALSQPKETGG